MKVLKDNYNESSENKVTIQVKPYPRKLICSECRSELEYDESDLKMGFLGCVYVHCPCCGYDNMLEENENTITLTKDNVEFPTHFWHTSASTGAKDCCNDKEIKECIQKAIKYFRENKGEDVYDWYAEYGNLYISVSKYDGDKSYEVTVSNDFYTTSIPFESADY